MSKVIKWGHKKLAGFSLLELMVVVAILGVLATVAVPRFNIFRARARQAEAKSNLGVIYTLQEAFAVDHEQYYNGDNANWGGTPMNTDSGRYGYQGSGNDGCDTEGKNKLGFRLANCGKARYGYFMNGGGENGFLAVAYAASDTVGDKRVFPGCNGNSSNTYSPSASSNAKYQCSTTNADGYAAANSNYSSGDAWCLDEARDLKNFRDITEECDN